MWYLSWHSGAGGAYPVQKYKSRMYDCAFRTRYKDNDSEELVFSFLPQNRLRKIFYCPCGLCFRHRFSAIFENPGGVAS